MPTKPTSSPPSMSPPTLRRSSASAAPDGVLRDPDFVLECSAHAADVACPGEGRMRQARATQSLLERVQAARQELARADGARPTRPASTEHCALGLMADALSRTPHRNSRTAATVRDGRGSAAATRPSCRGRSVRAHLPASRGIDLVPGRSAGQIRFRATLGQTCTRHRRRHQPTLRASTVLPNPWPQLRLISPIPTSKAVTAFELRRDAGGHDGTATSGESMLSAVHSR